MPGNGSGSRACGATAGDSACATDHAAVPSPGLPARPACSARQGRHVRPGGGDPGTTARRTRRRDGAGGAPAAAHRPGAVAARHQRRRPLQPSRRARRLGAARPAPARGRAVRSPWGRGPAPLPVEGPASGVEDRVAARAVSVATPEPLDARRQRLTLVAACVTQGMILLDVTIVNVALPAIQRELGVTPGNLEWVINAYALALATLILVGGALGDHYGRKRLLLIGLVVFTAGSGLCALARDDPVLIAARAVQGIGGALLTALTLSILVDAFPPERRTRAIGIWAAVAGLGFGMGPIVGGLLIAAFDWSAVFWVNVPIGLAALTAAWVGVRESRDPDARPLDPLGAALVAGGLCLLTVALIETNAAPWASPRIVTMLLAAAALLGGFVAWERRAPAPMLPLGLLGRRRFATAAVVFWAAYLALTGMFFYVTLYWQNLRGWSALRTGLSWIPLNLPFLVVSLNAGRLGTVFGCRLITTVGLVLAAAGMIGLAQLDAASSYQLAWPSFVLAGLGYGLLVPAVSSAAMGDVPRASAGVGSGVLNSARQVGVSVGLAVVGSFGVAATARAWGGTVATLPAAVRAQAASVLQRVAGGEGHAVAAALGPEALAPAVDAFLAGYRVALWAAGLALAAAALIAFAGMAPAAEGLGSSDARAADAISDASR